jgi:hypothetical protein
MKVTVAIPALSLGIVFVIAQPPAGGPFGVGFGGGRGGRGGRIPGATPEQMQAVNDMNAALAPLNVAVTAANNDLITATFSGKKDDAAITAAIEKLKAAELAQDETIRRVREASGGAEQAESRPGERSDCGRRTRR